MGDYLTASYPQPQQVHKDCCRLTPSAFRGIYRAASNGSIGALAFTWSGSDYGDQPRFNAPANTGHLQLWRRGVMVHDFGPQAAVQDATFTLPASWTPDESNPYDTGLLELGAYEWRCRQDLTAPGATADPRFGADQGGGHFVIVPFSAMPAIPPGHVGYEGDLDASLNSLLGIPTRVSILLGPPDGSRFALGSIAMSSQHDENAAQIATLVAYWKGTDTARTRPDGLPPKPIVMNFPDYNGSTTDAAMVQSIVALSTYANVDVVEATNEIRSDNGHEGGQLSSANLTLQQRFYAAVKAGAPTKKVGSPSSVSITPQGVANINGYLAAARSASGSSSQVYFDVLFVHDYPNASGTPGYQDYYRNRNAINWSGPVLSDEVGGVSAMQEGGGYPERQRRRVILDYRMRALAGLSTEGAGYFHTVPFPGGGSFPWGLTRGTSAKEQGAYPVVADLYVRRLALWGTSQLPEAWLNHPDPDEAYLVVAALYRHTTGGAQPAATSNTAVVDVQTFGDPDQSLTLAITGSVSGTVPVMTHWGRVVAATVTAGKITLTRTLLGDDGLIDGCYVFLPAGCSASIVNDDPNPVIAGGTIGIDSNKGTNGATVIRRVLNGGWQNALNYDTGNTDTSISIWRPQGLVHAGDPLLMPFTFEQRTRLRGRQVIVFAAPWQVQATATAFQLIGVDGGVQTVLHTVDTNPAPTVLDWRTDAAGYLSWHVTWWNDQHVFRTPLTFDATVQTLILKVTKSTYGGSPTLNAATGFDRTTVDGESGAMNAATLENYTGGNALGAGFAGGPRPGVQRAIFRGAPAATGGGGGGGGGGHPAGAYYLVGS